VLQKLEFEEFMSQLGVFLARQELRVIFDHFDANKDGNIAYAEFVGVLRVSSPIISEYATFTRSPLFSFKCSFAESFLRDLNICSGFNTGLG